MAPPSAKNEAAATSADLGIIEDVSAPGSLAVRVGGLVQVKKAHALIPSKTKRNAWTGDRAQLQDLLRHSSTAVYRLILDDGDVLVVSTKYLAAIGNATIRRNPHLTVDSSSVRHAGVLPTHYLADLGTVLRAGSNDKAVLCTDKRRLAPPRAPACPRQHCPVTARRPPPLGFGRSLTTNHAEPAEGLRRRLPAGSERAQLCGRGANGNAEAARTQ